MNIIATTFTLKALAALLAAVLPVTVKTNSGQTIEGNFGGIGAAVVRLDVAGETQSLSFDELASLTPTAIKSGTGPTFLVTLVSGSRIAADNLSLAAGELVIQPRRQQPLRVPVKQVKAIRFRAANAATDASWLGIVGREGRGDTLVIRRGEDRLDPQSGIIEGIADAKVAFDLEGDKIKAPIDKLEGLVFGGTDPISDSALIRLTDIYGSQWSAAAIQPSEADQPILLRLSDSITHAIPLEQIDSIRWSGGLVLLSGQQPAITTTTPYFQINLDQKLFDQFFSALAIQSTDLLVHGASRIEYRIEPGYQTLAGTVHRIESARYGSRLSVQIALDGTTVWQQELVGAEPRGFELPLGDARRLTIIVGNGDDGDLGDTVRIIRPRLTK